LKRQADLNDVQTSINAATQIPIRALLLHLNANATKESIEACCQWTSEQNLVIELDIQLSSCAEDGLLDILITIMRNLPNTSFVLNETGQPMIKAQAPRADNQRYTSNATMDAYDLALSQLAFSQNLLLKLSNVLGYFDIDIVRNAVEEFLVEQSSSAKGRTGPNCLLLTKALQRHFASVIECFGLERILYGSSCQTISDLLDVNSPGQMNSLLEFHYALCKSALLELGLEGESLDAIFANTANRIYKII